MKRLSVVAAVVLMLMMVLPRGVSALEVSMSPLVSCKPDCTGTVNGDKVVDPMDCTNYYYCFNGQPADHPNSCGDDSHFDSNQDPPGCVPGAECDAVCGGGGSGCAITCDGTMAVVANLFDCSTYYFCTPSGPVLVQCSVDFPYFDGTDCTHDESVCCPPYCDVYCDGSAFAMVPDPKDCGSFYVCEEGVVGDPGEAFKYSCGAGKYFNIALGNCETGDPNSCTTLCDAATGSTTTSDCVTSFTCPAEGFFPACHTCQPQYFDCAGAGVAGVMGTCSDGMVFNPTPGYGFCVLPDNCPYP